MRGITRNIEHEGAERLAIRAGSGSGAGANAPSSKMLSSLLGSRGVVVREGELEEWRIEGAVERDDGVYLFGPAFAGRSLDELGDASGGPDEALSALAFAASRLAFAAGRGALPPGLVSSGILLGDGELLVLPPAPALRAFRSLPPEERSRALAYLRSPRAEGPAAEAAFLVAQAAYRLASGERAFEAGRAAGDLAAGGFVPLSRLDPGLDPALAAAVDSALERPVSSGLANLSNALGDAARRGWRRKLAAGEEEEAARLLAATRSALDARRRRSDFLRRRGGLLAAVGAALAVVLALGLTLADARRGKPDFSALEPAEVVAAYYRAVDKLDLESIQAATARGAARADERTASALTVMVKARLAYEGADVLVRAGDWLAASRPPLPPDRILFGLTSLKIEPDPAGRASDGEAAYRAEYSLWSAERLEDGRAEPRERPVRDSLLLKRLGRRGWRIVSIAREYR